MIEPETLTRYRRELAAMARKAGTDDPDGFAAVVRTLDEARFLLRTAAARLRDAGYSWEDIGRAMGVTKQAAQQRFR